MKYSKLEASSEMQQDRAHTRQSLSNDHQAIPYTFSLFLASSYRSTARLVPQRAFANKPSCNKPKSCRDRPPRTRNMSAKSSWVMGSCSANRLLLPRPLPLLERRKSRLAPPPPETTPVPALAAAPVDENCASILSEELDCARFAPCFALLLLLLLLLLLVLVLFLLSGQSFDEAPSLLARPPSLRREPLLTLARRARCDRPLALLLLSLPCSPPLPPLFQAPPTPAAAAGA
jgi:hypothetical protein